MSEVMAGHGRGPDKRLFPPQPAGMGGLLCPLMLPLRVMVGELRAEVMVRALPRLALQFIVGRWLMLGHGWSPASGSAP
ncbi:hypothetical protein [Lichenifustis flavocetrariae]|uniref:Uncharacterized protein n=1 Tax=Lichenifustis flavocetrariae TaxID=2949735 RepID=A0AA42CM39_9HYPH|nr:hypothetical protein [Lichenifustis flavocetrariae]MCW6512274.1 hypothetical protein [Lichenifustis flavocetrariae]